MGDKREDWDASCMPSMDGKIALITGANSGIGFFAALELARRGAHVVLACRSEDKGLAAEKQINDELRAAEASAKDKTSGSALFMQLDVSSLASVKVFVERFKAKYDHLDLLVNNAGIFAVPYALSLDGFESQFATNHLGHFALTAQLFDVLRKSETGARIVNVASVMHWFARMKLDAIVTSEANYSPVGVYAHTKLYNLLFMKELDRRLRAKGIDNVKAVACHPGSARSNVFTVGQNESNWFMRQVWKLWVKLPFSQSSEMGSLPTLYVASVPSVQSGEYYGPRGFSNLQGYPKLEKTRNSSNSEEAARVLWEESERLAKISFTIE